MFICAVTGVRALVAAVYVNAGPIFKEPQAGKPWGDTGAATTFTIFSIRAELEKMYQPTTNGCELVFIWV